MNLPRIAAVVVVHQDDPRVTACLDALRSSEGVVVSAVVVDNGASAGVPPSLGGAHGDGVGGAIRRSLRLRRTANPGFAAGFNDGLAASGPEAPYVLSLNPDCYVRPDAVRLAAAELDRDPRLGAVAFRLYRTGEVALDSAGIVLDPILWRASDRGAGQAAAGRYLKPEDVAAACLAGALLRRTALYAAADGGGEVLDSRYFAYQEDVDLGARLRRAGWRIRYLPEAVATHERGWKEGERRAQPLFLRRCSVRNRLWNVLKNESWPAIFLRLPVLLLYEIARASYLLVREPDVLPAYRQAWRGVRETLRRRHSPRKP